MVNQYDRPSQLSGAGKATLVVMAAGLGSRFGGIKQLEPVGPGGETILEYSLFDAWRAGFSEVVFIIRKTMEADFRSTLLDRIRPGLSVRIAYQETDILPDSWDSSKGSHDTGERERIVRGRIKPWGTGHALWCARDSLESNFAVINADDYYGPASFTLLYDFLAHTPTDSDEYAMVGFELGKTLSDHGPVARGICGVDKDGFLTEIVEHTRLEADSRNGGAGRITSTQTDGTRTFHSGDTPVSMNLFGFTPAFLPRLENLLADFLAASASDPQAEFYLPGAVQSLVSAESATVRVLHSPETWFGLTYRADLDTVRVRVHQLVATGVYPPSLRGSG
jgi:NDP-sugar pyrophosphorylase family protein